ncbi:toll/interleukin-1 receptor domain-containing protein [Desulfitobacterium sp. AusDCA]|uniref:toll/interleukin-1 receptor domain-containing protein n=1 Tax=Desulfitobacterium sp. AusDCA TaxID=3240383 RepID=UPI003DA70D5B
MQPTDRINIIIQISRQLELEEWDIVDLTLNQFNLPTENLWGRDKNTYIVDMIKDADDTVLKMLATHFGIPVRHEPAREIESAHWKPDTFRVFLSHTSADKEQTSQIQAALEHFNISAFVAHVDIEPTKEWQTEIEIALFSCDALVALITPNFHQSNWTDQEIGIAIGRGLLIVPIRFGLDPYGFIGKFQGLQGTGKGPYQLALDIVKILMKSELTEQKMVSALVSAFEMSSSFQEAKDLISILEEVNSLNQALVERLKAAPSNNRQISHAYGVPERIEVLANKILNSAK